MRMNGPTPHTLVDMLRDTAAAQPGAAAYTFLNDGERCGPSLTWSQLERRSRAIGAAISARVGPGARVLVLFPPGLEFVPAFFGTLYAGAVAVPTYPPMGARADRAITRLRGMVADAGVGLVLAPAAILAHAAALEAAVPELEGTPWLDPADVPDEAADAWRLPAITRDTLAFLQYTSGSTSSPRGVMVSHGNLLHNMAETALDARYDRSSVSVSWLPVNHDMGLINGVLQPAYSGCAAYLMAPSAFLQRPARWLEAISRLGGTHSGGPNFAYDLAARRTDEDDRAGLDLSSWRVAYNGSEPVRRSTLEHFQRAFGACGFHWDAFCPAYGLAESTLLVTSVPAGTAPAFLGDAVASGLQAAERGVVIVNPSTRERCADGAVGEIWVRSESVASGYWNREAETTETFRAFTTGPGEGPFLRTGDMGFIHQDRLFVSGRIKDLLIVRGMKHYPQDIELTAERAHPALRPGCCAAFSMEHDGAERLAVIAEVDPRRQARRDRDDFEQIISSIRLSIAAAHQLAPFSVSLVAPGSVPKTTSGKLQRYLCREGLAAGVFETLAAWTSGAPEYERAAS